MQGMACIGLSIYFGHPFAAKRETYAKHALHRFSFFERPSAANR
jgi:hypothetical protein